MRPLAELERAARGEVPGLTYPELLQASAERFGDHPALILPGSRTTFAELAGQAETAAGRLRRLGVSTGDRVGILGLNGLPWLRTFLGVLSLGAVAVPLNGRDPTAALAWTLTTSDSAFLVHSPAVARRNLRRLGDDLAGAGWHGRSITFERLDELAAINVAPEGRPPWADPGDETLGVILFTSGSTAKPKGCMLGQEGMIRNACQHVARLGITAEDRWFSPMPFFHAGGMVWGVTSMLVSGATLVTQPKFDAGDAIALVERHRCTYHHGIDAMFVSEMAHPSFAPSRFASLKIVNSTGSAAMLRRLHDELGVDGVISKWGLSEGYGNLTLPHPVDDPLEKRLTTVGRGYPGIEYRIADPESGAALPHSQLGEIQTRGSRMLGYYGDRDATARMFDAGGWLRSGDLGSFDADGFLHYRGRLKAMLKVGGENVAAEEVESVLERHPSVRLAVVVPVPHPRLDQVPVAVVVPAAAEIREAELRAHCADLLADFKIPIAFHVRDLSAVPMTGSGKVARAALQAEFAGAAR